MSSVIALYEALASAPDDKTRAKVIAEAFERLEERYPHLPDLATQGHVRESELRLQKEIEQVRADLRETELRIRKEIEQVRAELKADIEQVRADLRETELRLKKDIEQLRGELKTDIEQLRGELKTDIERVKTDLLKWIVPLILAQIAATAALVKLL